MKLTYKQKAALQELAQAGDKGLRRSCTNATLCALERRELARWDMLPSQNVPGHKVETWFLTEAGKALAGGNHAA